ncbi:MAG: glycosyltransferase family 4 protein [Acidimicrobiales bacterium]|nr:glycosyltransferase family 4 protein [Acidimicrobiales bacterium]
MSRFLFVGHSPRVGGAELALEELVRGIVAEGHECVVALPAMGPMTERYRRAGARVVTARFTSWATLRRSIAARAARAALLPIGIAHLAWLIHQLSPDVIVSNTVVTGAGAPAAWLTRRRHVWFLHEFGDLDHGYRFVLGAPLSFGLIGRLSHAVVCCSHAVADRFAPYVRGVGPAVAYYAVEGSTASPSAPRRRSPEEPVRLVLVGTLSPGKGQLDAIRALARLRQHGLAATLDLVGPDTPPHGTALRSEVRQLGLLEAVRFVGPVEDPTPWYDGADVVLVCSRNEAFGRVTVEAMKRERPVVGAASGGTLELIAASGGGLVYPAGDVAALVEAVETVVDDADQALALGSDGRSWATARCTRERYVKAFMAAVEDLGPGPERAHRPSPPNTLRRVRTRMRASNDRLCRRR